MLFRSSLDLSLEAKVLNLFKALAALSDSEGGNKALKLMWSEGGVDSDKASGLQGAPMNPERPLELRKKALTQKDLMNGVETSYAIIFLRVPR